MKALPGEPRRKHVNVSKKVLSANALMHDQIEDKHIKQVTDRCQSVHEFIVSKPRISESACLSLGFGTSWNSQLWRQSAMERNEAYTQYPTQNHSPSFHIIPLFCFSQSLDCFTPVGPCY